MPKTLKLRVTKEDIIIFISIISSIRRVSIVYVMLFNLNLFMRVESCLT